jgi:hypothetical protein
MQLAATKAFLIWLALASPSTVVVGQQEIKSSAVGVQSPDRNYEAYWVDLPRARGLQARRLVFVVDGASNQLLFAHCTVERHTGAIWNAQSTACAIFDAPDNANVYIWVVKKQAAQGWVVEKIDVEKAAAQVTPGAFTQNPVRMGIERLSWADSETLNAQLVLNGKRIEVKLPVPSGA